MAELEFEKPVVELRNKIRELKDYTKNSQMDFSEEIRILEEKLENLEEDIYGNLKVMGPCSNCSSCRTTDNARLY